MISYPWCTRQNICCNGLSSFLSCSLFLWQVSHFLLNSCWRLFSPVTRVSRVSPSFMHVIRRFNTFSAAHERRKLTSRNIFGDVWDFPDDYQSIIAIQKKTRTIVIIIMIFRMIAMMIHIYSWLVLETSSSFAVIFVNFDDLLSSLILKDWKKYNVCSCFLFSMKYVH